LLHLEVKVLVRSGKSRTETMRWAVSRWNHIIGFSWGWWWHSRRACLFSACCSRVRWIIRQTPNTPASEQSFNCIHALGIA